MNEIMEEKGRVLYGIISKIFVVSLICYLITDTIDMLHTSVFMTFF